MTLPVSGSISLSQVNVELGRSASDALSMNDAALRSLFGVSSGAISMSQGYGKANQFAFAIASNQVQADLRSLALSAGWNGTSKVVATINSGVYIYSNSTGSPALTVSGSFPNGVQLINNGVIIGRGGNGGNGGYNGAVTSGNAPGGPGSGGGLALSVGVPVSITNNSIIAGGGGGGGAGGNSWAGNKTVGYGGGGGGGGIGNSSGGAGGTYGSYTGGAGGGGSVYGPGGGGAGFHYTYSSGDGGSGGSYGSSGAYGGTGVGASGFAGPGGAGGGAGACTSGNGYITWLAVGSRYGALN